jgi:copper chaperone
MRNTMNTDTRTYAVDGMTCAHCVASVTEELTALPGIDEVSIDLVPGGHSSVTVRGSAADDAESVRAAVVEAGYSTVES